MNIRKARGKRRVGLGRRRKFVGIGTELLDVHSPRERMNHKSVARVWHVIKDVMKSLDK